MSKLKAAWIGFREEGIEPFDSFKKYAEMGYKAMDGDLSRLPGDRDENFKRFCDLGLSCLCIWSPPMKDLVNDEAAIKKTMEQADFYQVKNINIGWSTVINSFGEGYGHNGSYDSMMQDIDIMNKLVKRFADEGFTPQYHNHYQEFTVTYKGVSVMDYFLSLIDPRLKIKLDVGWVYVGGLDPLEYMEKIKDRLGLLHVKDFTERIQPRYLTGSDTVSDFGFTSVGTGRLDLKGILGKACELGIEYAIAEQDRVRHLSWADSLHCAYLNMKETGFLE
ncbi:MAG: sugar phosphate isomerase/epimerase [Treponema sp.]|jgi:sugar phosphate isomerase/epimerase|nr:sugar phosphate isomerase/epimerase [Treponema sp.]